MVRWGTNWGSQLVEWTKQIESSDNHDMKRQNYSNDTLFNKRTYLSLSDKPTITLFLYNYKKKKTHDFTGLLQGTWISYHVQQPFRQFSISLQPTVSVFEVSWLWMASDWVFDSQFTYWVWWCVCDPLSVPDRKCYSLSKMHCFWNWSPVVRDQQGIGGIWTGVVGTWMTWK